MTYAVAVTSDGSCCCGSADPCDCFPSSGFCLTGDGGGVLGEPNFFDFYGPFAEMTPGVAPCTWVAGGSAAYQAVMGVGLHAHGAGGSPPLTQIVITGALWTPSRHAYYTADGPLDCVNGVTFTRDDYDPSDHTPVGPPTLTLGPTPCPGAGGCDGFDTLLSHTLTLTLYGCLSGGGAVTLSYSGTGCVWEGATEDFSVELDVVTGILTVVSLADPAGCNATYQTASFDETTSNVFTLISQTGGGTWDATITVSPLV